MIDIVLSFFGLIYVGGCIYAMFTDLTRLEIPNWLCITVGTAYIPYALVNGQSLYGIWLHVCVAAVTLLIGFLLHLAGVLGGGDGKFLAAVIIWMKIPRHVPEFIVYTALFGGILGFVFLIFRLLPMPAKWQENATFARLYDRSNGLPYGIAIGGAGLLYADRFLPVF